MVNGENYKVISGGRKTVLTVHWENHDTLEIPEPGLVFTLQECLRPEDNGSNSSLLCQH